MINRRHIRLKVLQSIYAYFTSNEKDLAIAQKQMLKQIGSISSLYFLLLSIPIALTRFSKVFFDEQKNKHFATEEDKSPNENFTNNLIVKRIAEDEVLIRRINKASGVWLNSEYNFIRKLFVKIWGSDLYKNYIATKETNFNKDKELFLNIFDNFIVDDELLHHILEEESICWLDDLPFVASIVFYQIKVAKEDKIFFNQTVVFKNKEDKAFAKKLFNNTIIHHKEFEKIISKKAKNWDLERIALMDQILIMMALCELIYFNEIPIKVSLNEYIEVAKYYSTKKSKSFINGILDKVVAEFKESGKIRKIGRGLIE